MATRSTRGTARKATGKTAGVSRRTAAPARAKAAKKPAAKKTAVRTAAKKVAAGKAAPRKAASRKTPASKVAARKSAARKTVARKAVAKKTTVKKVAAGESPARKAAARKTAARKTTTRKAATKKVATKRVATKKVATKKVATRKLAAKRPATRGTATTVAKKTAVRRATGVASGRRTNALEAAVSAPPPRKRVATARRARAAAITPELALEKTRELLQAHQDQARQTPAWRLLEEPHGGTQVTGDGHVPAEVAAKVQELHAGESRMRAIQGSASTHDRRNQRKRDHR